MTFPRDPGSFPPPDPQRVDAALGAMRARRTRLRRVRIVGASCALALIAAVSVAVVAGATSSGARHGVRVEGGPSTNSSAVTGTTRPAETTTTASSTTTFATTTTTVAAPSTQQITYQPFIAAGAVDPALRVTGSASGTCMPGESARSFRCFGGAGGIYDPCFAGPHGNADPFVCPEDPRTHDITEFTAKTVTSDSPTTKIRAWAIELANGQLCRAETGATGGLGGYVCFGDNTPTTAADCQTPQPAPLLWAAECQREESQTSPLSSYPVLRVWF